MNEIKIKLSCKDKENYKIALKYYSILCIISNIKLTERELELVAFTSTFGNITKVNAREKFYEQTGSSPASTNNMISKLKRLDLLIKDKEGVIKINPIFAVDFNSDIIVLLQLKHE